MSQLKFEGDIEVVTDCQREYIISVLEKRGYKNGKLLVQPVGQPGDGFVANVKRIIVEKDGETLKMIAKIAPTGEATRAAIDAGLIFRNEHIMYTQVLPTLDELQKSVGVPKNERLRFAACYGSVMEPLNELLLLEDLAESNFVMLDKTKSLTDETVKIILKNFAILHSSSYALKKQEPETYAAFKLINTSELIKVFKAMEGGLEQLENEILTIVDDKYKKLFKGAIVSLLTHVTNNQEIDKKSKYSVILQGDAWTNNMMFRLKNESVVECCLIDYQVSRESNPAADIQNMIFMCTDYSTKTKHYHEWIDYYHTELDKRLDNYGLKANDILPREQLDVALRRYGKQTLAMSCLAASVVIREAADIAVLREAVDTQGLGGMFSKVSLLDKNTVLRFKERVEGLLNSFLELGLL